MAQKQTQLFFSSVLIVWCRFFMTGPVQCLCKSDYFPLCVLNIPVVQPRNHDTSTNHTTQNWTSSTLINCHIKCTRIYIYMEKWRRDTPSSDYRFDDVTFLFPTKTRRKETCRRSSCYYKYCTVTGGDGASDNWAGIEKAHDGARWDFFFFLLSLIQRQRC